MAERGELDLTGAKQNTGVWLVKVSRETRGALPPRLFPVFESSGSPCPEKTVAVASVSWLEKLL